MTIDINHNYSPIIPEGLDPLLSSQFLKGTLFSFNRFKS